MISVIIPARQEPYINKTIESLYDNASGEIEVIVVLDGENADIDPRAKVILHPVPLGRRVGMNEGAAIAKGEYLLHIDAHCSMTPEWDKKLQEVCTENTLVVSSVAAMNEKTWEKKPKHYYTFVSLDKNLIEHWWGKYKKLPDCAVTEETMALTGCGWMIRNDYYWKLGGCDESLGQLGHLGPEWALKVWCNSGRLILRTDVFCGHVFACHSKKIQPYSPQRIGDIDFRDRMYAKYSDKIEWLKEKFDPPGWEETKEIITKTEQTIKIRKLDGTEDVIDICKEYFPVERPKDSTITYTDWRLLWQTICDKNIKSLVEFGPGLSTEILNRCSIRITSYETHPSILNRLSDKMPDIEFVLWDGKQAVDLDGQYDMAFIDGPFGGANREYSYKSIANSNIRFVACHDSNRKADKVWIDKYFGNWKKVCENPLKTGLLILEREIK